MTAPRAPAKKPVRSRIQSRLHSIWYKVRHPINGCCQHELFLWLIMYLSSLGKCWPMVAATNAQHILCTVKELGETIELAVVEVNGRLVDAIQWGLAGVGASQQGGQHGPTSRPVPSSSDMQDLTVPFHHLCESHRQAGIQKRIVRTQTCLVAQQPVTVTKTNKSHHYCTQFPQTCFPDVLLFFYMSALNTRMHITT